MLDTSGGWREKKQNSKDTGSYIKSRIANRLRSKFKAHAVSMKATKTHVRTINDPKVAQSFIGHAKDILQ